MIAPPTRRAFEALAQAGRQLLALRWFRVLVLVAGLVLVFRLGLGLLLSRAIDVVVAPRGLACDWEDLDLSILSGRGEVRFLTLTPREDHAGRAAQGTTPVGPIAVVEYADFDVEILPLFVGKLRIRRLEIDGMQVLLDRAGNGAWNLERLLASAPSSAPAGGEAAVAPEENPPKPIDLAPPASIEALRVQDVSVRLVDRTFTPEFVRNFHVDAGIANFFSSSRPTRFSATLTGDRVLDGAHVEGEALWTSDRIALDLRAQLGGLRPRELAPYLEPLGVEPACDSIQGRLEAHVDVDVTGANRDAVRVKATVSDVNLAADGVEALALDSFVVEVDSLSSRGASLPRIELSGARARASIEPSQALRVAGLDLSTEPPPDARVEALAEARGSWLDSLGDAFQLALGDRVPRWATLLVRDDPHAYPWSLARLALTHGAVHLVDHRVDPPAEFPILVDVIEARDIVHERATAPRPIALHAEVRVPGLAETLRVEGRAAPFVPERNIDLTIGVDGLTLDSLRGYLRSAGLESTVTRGGLRFHLGGEATTDARGVTDGWLELEESLALDGKEASQLGRVRACDLHFDPPARSVRLGDIEVAGTQIVFARDPSRRLVALGMRTLGLGAAPSASGAPGSRAPADSGAGVAAPPGAPPGAPDAAEAALPLVEIGRFAWTDSHLAFVDESVDPPRRLTVDPMGLELTGLTIGGPTGGSDPPPAHFRARARAPGIFDEVKLEGLVRSKRGGIDLAADLAFTGSGLHGAMIAPYLDELGFEPVLADGKAALDVHAELRRRDGWRGSLRLANGDFSDAGESVMALKELRVDDVVATGALLSIGRISIVDPFLRIEHPRESGVRAAGLRFVGSTPTSTPTSNSTATATAAATSAEPLVYPQLPPILVREASLSGARITWKDETFEPALEAELRIDGSASDLATTGAPGKISARVQVPGSIDALDFASEIVVRPDGARLDATVRASGVRAGPLARLMPPGASLECEDGRFQLGLEAGVGPAPDGGLRARVAATDVAWRDGEAEPWFACRLALLEIPRVDPAAGVLEIGPISVEGLSVQASREAKGDLHALGVRIAAEEATEPAAAPAAAAVPAAPAAPVAPAAPAAGPAVAAAAAAAAAAEPAVERKSAAPTWSRIALAGDVRLGLDRFVFRDAGLGPDARALEGAVALRVDGPRTLLGGAREDLPPISWSVEGSLRGLVERWRIEGELRPFADEPGLRASLAASGVRTQGVIELVPALASSLHGDVEQGTLEGKLDANLSVRRSRPTDLGLGRAFGADLRLAGLAFRTAPQGEVLAGIDAVAVDFDRIDLAKKIVHAKTLEITRPRGLVRRTATAISACGLALDLTPREAPAAAATAPEPAGGKAVEASAPAPRRPATSAPAAGALEVGVERLLVSGIAAEIRDERGESARSLPLASLDVEARGLTTRALRERVPLRFHAILTGGPPQSAGDVAAANARFAPPVSTPPVSAPSVSEPLVSATPVSVPQVSAPQVSAPQVSATPVSAPSVSVTLVSAPLVSAPWFDELGLSGDLSLRPEPTGWVRLSLTGLDLPVVAALAPAQGVTVSEGALDLRTQVKLQGSHSARVQTTVVFTDLQIAEPKGGPIEKKLALPVGLDAALFLLRNPAGEHRMSVGFTVDEGGFSTGQIALAATEAAAQVLGVALAGAPLRLISALVPTGGKKARGPRAVAEIEFAPGSCELPPDLEARLLSLRRELAGNRSLGLVVRHELGAADRAQAERRANPPAEECGDLVLRGRQRKAELLRSRAEAATRARALLAVGARESGAACDALRAIDRELAAVESNLDRVLEILRTPSERQARKRTRFAALEIARDRLELVTKQLKAGLEAEDFDRIDSREPRFEVREGEGQGRIVLELRER